MAQTTTTDTPTIGAFIRAWRLFRGLSRKALAEKAGVRGEYLSEIEHDKKKNPWLGQLEKLAAALEITLQDIQDRHLPPEQGKGEDHQTGAPVPQAIFPPPPSTAQVPQLEELIAEVRALKAEVAEVKSAVTEINSTLQEIACSPIPQQVAEELHELLRLVREELEEQDYLAPPPLLEDAAQVHPFIGHWQGYAWQELRKDTSVLLLSSLQNRLEVPRDMTVAIDARLTLESAGGTELSGEGRLRFDFRPVGVELVKTVYVHITGAVIKAGRLTLELENLADTGDRAHLSGRLNEDGRLLRGAYRGFGLIVGKSGTVELPLEKTNGEFSLEKVDIVHPSEEHEGVFLGRASEQERPE